MAGEALLRVCANPDGANPDGDAAGLEELGEAEWHELADLACQERAAPLLREAIRRAGARIALPEPVAERLAAMARWHSLYTLKQGVALVRLSRLLAEAGMRPIALKGVPLARRFYPRPDLRPLRDLDLLLDARQAVAAQDMLLARETYEKAAWAGRYGIEHGHQLPEIRDSDAGVTIELHHRLSARGWQEEPALLDMTRRDAVEIAIQGESLLVPSPHALLLHVVEHATLHHFFENGPLVLADVHYLARSGAIDWPRLIAQARPMGLFPALCLVAAVARRYGADWMPDELAPHLEAARDHVAIAATAALQSKDTAREQGILRRLETAPARASGWRTALARSFRPNPYELAKFAGTGAESSLRWLGYPGWLIDRGSLYFRARRKAETARLSARQTAARQWLTSAGSTAIGRE